MATLGRIVAVAQRNAIVPKRTFSALVSIADEFPGLPATSPEQGKASTATVSTLSNGATLVTEDAASSTTVTITYPGAGSGSEAAGEEGAALANQCMSFKSGSGISTILIYRNLEDEGATPFSSAGRFGATVGFTSAPEKATRLIPLLATQSTFEKWDVRDAKKVAAVQVEDAGKSAQVVLTESIYAAAYGAQSPLGKPYYTAGVSTDAMMSFRESAYGLSGAVIAATGVSDHGAFASAVEERLAEAAVGSKPEAVVSPYMGGETRVHAPSSGYANVAIAFEAPASSAMAGVIKQCMILAGVDAFVAPGLVGVYGGASAPEAAGIVDTLSAALTTAPDADVISRAKGLAKAEALFGLDEGSKALAEAMTSGVLESGSFSAAGIAGEIDAITAAQVKSALKAMIKSNPSVASVGDISTIPYHATVAAQLS